MFLDKALDEIGRKNKIVIGLDLTNDYVQIRWKRVQKSWRQQNLQQPQAAEQ